MITQPYQPITINVKKFPVIDDIYIKTSDRIAIFGISGGGKSVFAKNWLLPHYDRYLFWDIKVENDDVVHDIVIRNPEKLEQLIDKYDRILYQPDNAEPEDFDEVCKIVFQHRNNAIYVDEATRITTPNKIGYWYNTIITQGRSYNVGNITVSQRPNNIHNTIISESLHFFIFKLNLPRDIDKLRDMIGSVVDNIRLLPEFHFIYYSVKDNKAMIFQPVGDIVEGKASELKLWQPTLKEYLKLVKSRSI